MTSLLLTKKSECCMTIANPVTAETPEQATTLEQVTTEQQAVPTSEKPANVKDVLAFLCQSFPKCFISSGPLQPLKVGIFQDLAARLGDNATVSKTQLRQALRVYTSSWRYLEATKEGVNRIDLEGQPAELIDAQQAEHAAKLLAESKQKAAEKRKVKQQEQRAQQTAKPQADRAAAKDKVARPVQKTANKNPKAASNAAQRSAKPARAAEKPAVVQPVVQLTALVAEQLKVGAAVLVKLGSSPMPATVTEVNLPDVTVQLSSGMVIKTRQDSLYQA